MSLNVTQSNQNLTLHVSQSNVKATLSVTQNINELHITAIQNNEITKLQPIVNTSSSDFIETDPIFQASEASLFVAGDKANLDNQSGINTGDETTLSIRTKRPLKTINGESLEGSGNVQIDYNDLDNLPTIPIPITNHSGLNLDDGTNPHGTTKSDVGLGNVDNTSDINKPISTATQVALNGKLDKDNIAGVERAYIINPDGSQGTKSTSEFKDVVEGYFNGTNFYKDAGFTILITGETSKIYLALDTNKTYRWSGSAYVQIGGGKRYQTFLFQSAGATITADQKNFHQSRITAGSSVFSTLGLTFGNGIYDTTGVLDLHYLSDVGVPNITPNYISKVKNIKFSYSRNISESGGNTNIMIRVMADTKYGFDMQLIAEYNLISSSVMAWRENKVDIPILTHLPLSSYSNLKWCVRVNNATAQTFSFIRLNIDIEEV